MIRIIKLKILCVICALMQMTMVHAQEKTGQPVDLVFCVDLSSSSNGLVDHLRNHLWDYWYFFSRCTPQPDFRVGIVTYARYSYGKQSGYSKVLNDLSTDFESMSNNLFRISSRIERGEQYVGSALNTCLKKISWSKNPDALKVIILVGNGDVTLGPDDIDQALDKLRAQKIIVNGIYCTVPGEKTAIKGWQRVTDKGNGKLEAVSLRHQYFDRLNGFNMRKFRTLNRKFNNTYLYYSRNGKKRWRILQEEDNNIYVTNTEGFRLRSLYKISDYYQQQQHDWDLVDLYYKNPVGFMEAERELFNDTCRKMSPQDLKAYIIYKKYERRQLAALIAEMITDKELKDKADGKKVLKNMQTMDIVAMRMMRDLLEGYGCKCNIH